jgi:hypothetical protein
MSNAVTNSIPEGFESKRLGGSLAFQNPKNWSGIGQTGRMVVGTFLGLTEPSPFGKRDYMVLATEAGISIDKEGNIKNYSAGTKVTLNASGSLTKQMVDVNPGDSVIVDFDGTEKIRKGPYKGRDAHNFTVYVKRGDGTIPELATEAAPEAPSISAETKAKLAGLSKKAN